MKHILRAMALAFVVVLAGCAGFNLDPVVQVATSALDEGTSTTGRTTGMDSSHAADVLKHRDYYSAIKAIAAPKQAARRPLVEIKARPGKPITIDAESFTVYEPDTAGQAQGYSIAAPKEVEPTGLKYLRAAGDFAARVFVPWTLIREQADTARLRDNNATKTRLGELGVMSETIQGAQGLAGQAIAKEPPAPLIVKPFVVETAP
jgi:hypothetical protein